MRRFGQLDLGAIDSMTYREFRLRMKAYALQRLDKEYDIALMAWQVREIEAKKKSGKGKYKYTYDSFRKFFDLEAREKAIFGKDEVKAGRKSAAERYKDYMREKQCQK